MPVPLPGARLPLGAAVTDPSALADAAEELLRRTGAPLVLCDAGDLATADAAAVDGLARVAVRALRMGRGMRVVGVTDELVALAAWMGLYAALRVEAGGQPEEREQALRVEEEPELDDPAA